MSQILSSSCILTFDQKNSIICILSTEQNNKIVFPTFRIESTKNLHNEIRYQIKNLFIDDNAKFIEDIVVSYTDIQNNLYVDYLKELGVTSFDENNDIILLNSIVVGDKFNTKLYWRPYDHTIDIKNKDTFGLLIDHILQKTIL